MLQDIRYDSNNDGPNLLVLGAVHGNEVAGTKACKRVVKYIETGRLNIIKGSLTLVPIANPMAYEKDIRQIDENLNRVIKKWDNPKTYEQTLGIEIAKKIDACDCLLDLHSTHNEGEVPFSFLDYPIKTNRKIVAALDVEYVLSGWPEVYGTQDEIKDFSTETYANSVGKSGVTLECGYHKDEDASDVAYNSIINLMKMLGMIEGKASLKDKKTIRMTNVVTKNKEGHLTKKFKNLDIVAKGTVVAKCDDGEEIVVDKDYYIIIPNHDAKIGTEWYYLGVDDNEFK